MADQDDFDLSAAGLRADGGDLLTTVEVMARKLEDALPAQTRVERKAKRLFGGGRRVAAVEVSLGDWRYRLTFDGRTAAGWRERQVGGIAIKREVLALSAWLEALTDELRAAAQQSSDARQALGRLLGQ